MLYDSRPSPIICLSISLIINFRLNGVKKMLPAVSCYKMVYNFKFGDTLADYRNISHT